MTSTTVITAEILEMPLYRLPLTIERRGKLNSLFIKNKELFLK